MSERFLKYTQCLDFLDRVSVPAGVVYHYTDWIGLQGILKTQELWLTDVAHLNDTSEVKYAIRELKKLILSTEFEPEQLKEFWENSLDLLTKIMPNFINFYIASFCGEPDNLYAWRAYSNDGAGFAIGFKPEFFENLKKSVSPSFASSKVYYDDDNLDELNSHITQLVHAVNIDVKPLLPEVNALFSSRDFLNNIAGDFYSALMPLLVSIKHKAYKDEHEHRIYHFSDNSLGNSKFFSPGDNHSAPHLNPRRRILHRFDLNNIAEIWVGPRLSYEYAKRDLLNILDQLKRDGHKLDPIDIKESFIQYKNNY